MSIEDILSRRNGYRWQLLGSSFQTIRRTIPRILASLWMDTDAYADAQASDACFIRYVRDFFEAEECGFPRDLNLTVDRLAAEISFTNECLVLPFPKPPAHEAELYQYWSKRLADISTFSNSGVCGCSVATDCGCCFTD